MNKMMWNTIEYCGYYFVYVAELSRVLSWELLCTTCNDQWYEMDNFGFEQNDHIYMYDSYDSYAIHDEHGW